MVLRALIFPAVLAISACSTTENRGTATPSRAAEPAPPSAASAICEKDGPDSIRITLGNESVRGSLNDSPAAVALRDRLPLTVDLRDYNSVEKTGGIDPLPMNDMPAGAAAAPGTIGYYAPDQVLVLYYRSVPYFPGIAILGEFDSSTGAIGAETPDLRATLELGCVARS